MARVARLTFIAAGFDRAHRLHDPTVRLPTLERLLARGNVRRAATQEPSFHALESWQREVLRVTSHEAVPSAPVSALGADLARDAGTWLHAQFVHFAAGLDHLVLVPLHGAQALDADASAQLQASLAAHVHEESYEWHAAGGRHFLHTRVLLSADTCAPDAATRLSLVDAMPRGPDGRTLRRLMTELQMQLHEHPLNRERERAGLLAANGVWLWGLGTQAAIGSPPSLPRAFAGDDFVRGLYRMNGDDCAALPSDAASLFDAPADELLVLVHCESLSALQTRWLVPIERALQAGRIGQLELILDDMQVIATRWHCFRLWRTARALSEAHG